MISTSNRLYPYKAIIEALSEYGESASTSWLAASGFVWWREGGTHKLAAKAELQPMFNDFLAPGFVAGKEQTFRGPLFGDIMNQDRTLLSNTRVTINLSRASNPFLIASPTDTVKKYVLKITDMSLFLRHVNLDDTFRVGLEKQLAHKPAAYPFVRTEMRSFVVGKGVNSWNNANAFQGPLPRRIVFGLVTDVSASGSQTTDPFYFAHHDVNSIEVTYNGKRVPSYALKPDFSNLPYSASSIYTESMKGLGKCLYNSDCGLSMTEWTKGKTLYAIDFAPHMGQSDCFSPHADCGLSISLGFGTATTAVLNLILFGQFESIVTIDQSRNVLRDY